MIAELMSHQPLKWVDTKIALRVNPDIETPTHEKIATASHKTKFGIDRDQTLEIIKGPHGDKVKAVTCHPGSQMTRLMHLNLLVHFWKISFRSLAVTDGLLIMLESEADLGLITDLETFQI